ncbi:hypothetical protein Sango_2367300 [Sesamum angolense]|uniref:Uncharacterized protein n=1 Tax=Sesamum angolense TaxID=2727404 RepID=A0AAE1W6E3_9LAMI|nr:hypothetical protein Sango_2367300 [Sesamum angolense]
MSHREVLKSLRPTEPLDLESGLSLAPRVKLNLTIDRADKTVSPVDEWKLKRSLIDYLKTSHSISVAEEDIKIFKYRDLKKRKREDPVARGSLVVLDLGFLSKKLALSGEDGVEKDFLEWRKGIVAEMDGMELNLEGVKFKLSVAVPKGDDFEGMRKEWEEIAAFGRRGYPRSDRQQPDTIILRGVPSRWFAEPRVSSKPSMLVTHTIFSAFGKIRNLDVGEDNDIGQDEDEDSRDLVSGLHCKIVVQFESHKDFYNALKVLCGRSLIKQGSRMRSDYEVTWDRDGYFRNGQNRAEQSKRWMPTTGVASHRSEASGRQSQVSRYSPDDARRKRFKFVKICRIEENFLSVSEDFMVGVERLVIKIPKFIFEASLVSLTKVHLFLYPGPRLHINLPYEEGILMPGSSNIEQGGKHCLLLSDSVKFTFVPADQAIPD